MMLMPARSPATRCAVNAGWAALRTFWPSSRREIRPSPRTSVTTRIPTTSTTTHSRTAIRLSLLLRMKNLHTDGDPRAPGGSPGNAAHARPRGDPASLRSRNCEAEYMHNQLTIEEAEGAALDTLGVAQYP